MKEADDYKLKPCPFCGGTAEVGYAINDYNRYGVYCKNCGATVEVKDWKGMEDTEENAIKVWNQRTIDYDSLTRGKLCPLKAPEPPNLDAILRVGAIKCRTDGEPPRVEYIGGRCDGPRCAWWDASKGRCAALSLSPQKNDNTPACS